MTTQFQRRAVAVQAFQFTGQSKEDWPNWAQSYSVYSAFGQQPIAESLGNLVVPTRGNSIVAANGDWLVLEGYDTDDTGTISGGVVGVYKKGEFHDHFEETAETDAG